jgi:hypothetical protein
MRPFPAPFRATLVAAALLPALALAGCSNDSPAAPALGPCADVDDLASCLPAWSQYAPALADAAPTVTSESSREETSPLQRIDSTGATVSIGAVTFVCTDRTYTFTDNPDRATSFSIDETKIWPGALLQGRSHRDGASIASLAALPIAERAPMSVTLTFNNNDNTRVVDVPSYGSMATALGSMIGNAEAEGLATANSIDYLARTYNSERQAAHEFGFSGRYLAFEASASGAITRTTSRNTVAAKFVQQMYIAGVTQPPTPAAFFSNAFTDARYREQAELDRISPSNPPLYVSRIGYGRMMLFAMSAEAEASEILATLNTTYQGIGAGGSAGLNSQQTAILERSEIRITQVGGDQTSALNAIRTGRLADYFTDRAALTSAAPLWFELKTLTGEPAGVSEPGTYTETTCVPRLPGTFDYEPEVALAIPFDAGTQRQTLSADVNGDGRMDLVFNERRSSPALNRVHVAFAQASGGFTLAAPATHPDAPAEGWETYTVVAADVDGDGRDDLVWNHRNTHNVVYAGMSTGAGAFAFRSRQQHVNSGWSNYTLVTGDMNGDGRTDLVWNHRLSATFMRTYVGLARPDSTFVMSSNFIDRPGDHRGYTPARFGRFTGATSGGIILNALSASYNNTYRGNYAATSDTTGTFAWGLHSRGSGWANYQFHVADIDGVNAMDLLWLRVDATVTQIHWARNNGTGAFSNRPLVTAPLGDGAAPYFGDFNNDGRTDVMLNRRTTTLNELIVGYGTDSSLTFPAGPQRHPLAPAAGWQTVDQVFVGDVNGDGKADIVWTIPSGDARVYVALAR